MNSEDRRQRPARGHRRAPAVGLCLCAEISFDGKLLDAPEDAEREPGPAWWRGLLARKRSLPVEADTVRALLDTGQVGELCLRVKPCVDGRADRATLSGPGRNAPFFARSITWELVRMGATAGGDCLLHYRRADG